MKRMFNFFFLIAGSFVLIQYGALARDIESDIDSLRQTCRKKPAEYETYTVKSVRIVTSFLIFPARADVSMLLAIAQNKVRNRNDRVLEKDGFFTESGYLNLQVQLNNDLRDLLFTSSGGFLVIKPRILNCDDKTKEVQIEYVIFGAPISSQSYLKGAYELPGLYLNRRKATVSVTESPFQFVPFAGYNESRGLFGGARIGKRFERFKLVNKFDFNADFSASSFTLNTTLAGSQHFKSVLFDYANWRIGYNFSKLPAASLTLIASTFSAQFFGATRPTVVGNTIFRYGTVIERGTRVTNLPENVLPSSNLKSSGYAATKFYVGGSSTWGQHSLKASYGLQLGNTGKDFQVNYIKNILDAAYRARFLVADHRPLQIDAQFSSGRVNLIYGSIPAAERFFGGNVENEFIHGDSWRIRSNPVIRSISQNRFNGSGSGGYPIGGDQFLSGNLTMSFPVWQQQLIPDEIGEDPTLITALRGGVRSGRLVMTDSEAQKMRTDSAQDIEIFKAYKKSDIQFLVSFLNDTSNVDILKITDSIRSIISPQMDLLNEKIKTAAENNHADSVLMYSKQLKLFASVESYSKSIELFLPMQEDSADFDNDTEYDLEDMFLGYGNALPGYVPGLLTGIQALKTFYKSKNLKKEWFTLGALSEKLLVVQDKLKLHFRKIEIPIAESRAKPNVDYVGKVLGALFKEVNLLSISPFAMLDAARLGIANRQAGNAFQRGLGAGIRLSLINFDVYAGYSFNLNRQLNDKKGAFVFTIDITDLF